MPSPHTKEVLSSVLLDTLLEWNFDRKLSTVTMDNCSTNDVVIKIILDKLQRGALIMRGSMLHMRCAAHVLNLIVQDGLDVIGTCIERFEKVWDFGLHQQREGRSLKRQLDKHMLNVPKN